MIKHFLKAKVSTRNFPSKASFAMAYGVFVLAAFAFACGAFFFFLDPLAFAEALLLLFAAALAQKRQVKASLSRNKLTGYDRISQLHTLKFLFPLYFNGVLILSTWFFTSHPSPENSKSMGRACDLQPSHIVFGFWSLFCLLTTLLCCQLDFCKGCRDSFWFGLVGQLLLGRLHLRFLATWRWCGQHRDLALEDMCRGCTPPQSSL